MTTTFKDLSYKKFIELAKNSDLGMWERVGFPEEYRQNKTIPILQDILSKLTNLQKLEKNFLEIGPGASELANEILNFCEAKKHKTVFVDSAEMLSLVEDRSSLQKVTGCFPDNFDSVQKLGPFDAILTYSVLQYPFAEGNVWSFIDKACSLLKEGGQFLIGDIPNISMRKRFFASSEGVRCHQNYTNAEETPEVNFNMLEHDQIDDGVLIGIMARLRNAGFHVFLLPQNDELPMANRREDMLIIKP